MGAGTNVSPLCHPGEKNPDRVNSAVKNGAPPVSTSHSPPSAPGSIALRIPPES